MVVKNKTYVTEDERHWESVNIGQHKHGWRSSW